MFSNLSNMANEVNNSFIPILVISLVLLALVTLFMVYFAFRYRRKISPVPTTVKGPLLLEITWTVIPTILVIVMFYFGWNNYEPMRTPPDNAMEIMVKARMWSWQFEYENGHKSGTLNAPLGIPVKLTITSDDVLHSLFIPSFKVKEDAVPGMHTMLWFIPQKTGKFKIVCAEYCGHGHSSMNTFVEVMPEAVFSNWYKTTAPIKAEEAVSPPATEILDDYGCLDCHSTDGEEIVGPTFKGIYGRHEVVITEGNEREITVDDKYLKTSIEYPESDVVKGYDDVMPSFEGEISDEEIESIIQYLKNLK
jgi:cytochrome c oxidase subunit 2